MRCFHCMNSIPDGAALCPYCNEAPSKENPPYCLTAGTVLKNKYIIGNVIGEGGFGITYAGWDTVLGQKIAVKEYYPSICANRSHTGDNQVIPGQASKGQYFRMGKERFTQEAQSAAQFSGEAGIVKILDYFEENDTAYIVMNYVEGGNLGEIVRSRGKLEPKTFFAVMLPLMRTLEHVHQTGMIHRDIAPDNIIMSQDGSLTLLDFGSARYYFGEETKSLSVVLKPGYAPYEQYSRKGRQGAWTDVYALCATIYKCITGETPPDALDRAVNDELKKPSELGVRLPAAIETALMKGLAVFPKDRLQTVGELRKAVEKGYPAEKAVDVKPEKVKKKPKRKIMIAAIAVVLACTVAAVSVFVVVPNVQKSTNSSQQEETQQSETQLQQTNSLIDTNSTKALFQSLSNIKLTHNFNRGSDMINVNADQSFTKLYSQAGDKYEESDVYNTYNVELGLRINSQSGTFTNVKKINDFTYTMQISNLSDTTSEDQEMLSAKFPHLSEPGACIAITDNFSGIYDGSEITLYTPEAPISQIPKEISEDHGKMHITPNGNYLGYYCLVDSKGIRYYAEAY